MNTIKPTGCCEPFDPKPWEDKEITWHDKIFIKDHVASFLHIPLNMGKKIIKNMAAFLYHEKSPTKNSP